MESLGPIVRARGDAITRAPPGPPEADRPGHHSRNLSWDSSTSYNGSCSVSIRSERTFDQRRSSTTVGSEQAAVSTTPIYVNLSSSSVGLPKFPLRDFKDDGNDNNGNNGGGCMANPAGRTSTSPTNQHNSLPSPIFPASSASYLTRSTVSSSAASVITASTATTRSRSFSIDSRSVYSLSEKDAPPTPTPRTRQRLQDTGAGSSTQQDTSRSRVSMDAVTPADETQSHTPRPDLWRSVSQSSLAMSSAAESSKRRGRVSFGPMENYDWTATGAGDPFASSSRLDAVSPPPRPPRRKSVPSLGYGLAQQYCRPESEEEDTEPEDDWEERAQRTPTAFADSTLRSAPGVRGIGEGWAGGPQLSKTSWWKRRKRDALEDDPLALWEMAGKSKADTASPVKALWNRSVQAFGGSMPHLPLERRRTSKKDREKPTSQGTILEDEEREPTGRRSMRQLFSRSTTSLAGAEQLPKVRDRIPMSYSTSHLVSAPANSTGRIVPRSPIKERPSFVGSDTDSSATPTFSSKDTRRVSGPRPPWRPQSHISIGQPLNEDDTEDGLATPKMDRDGSGGTATSDSSAARTERSIRRTSTFGAGLIADEPAHIVGHDNAPSETAAHRYEPVRDDYWSRRRDEMRDSTVGLDTIAQWSTEPKERMALPSRRPSIFRKIQQALGTPRSVSMRRSDSPSPLRLFSRATTPAFGRSTPAPGRGATSPPPAMSVERPASPMRATTDPAYLIMHEAVKEALDTPPRAPQRSQTMRHRRRASWMSQGDGWMKRLSMLMEQDEDDRENRSSTVSPISCISPQSPTPRGTKQAQRQSFFSTAVPQRTSSLRRPAMTPTRGSMSTPALTRLTTTDLDLRLVLPDAGLGLDDILIDSKRQSIIEMLDLDIPSTFPFPVPPARSPMAPALSRNPSVMSGHARNASEPVNSLTPTTVRTSSHVRNFSEPADVVPLLEESRSIPHSTGSASSSTFPETPHLTRADLCPRRSRDHDLSHKSSAASTTSWTDTSFHSAKEPAVEEVSLYKALSRLSDVSELGAVVEAVRIPSMGGTRKANMVTIEELRNSPMSTRPSTPVV